MSVPELALAANTSDPARRSQLFLSGMYELARQREADATAQLEALNAGAAAAIVGARAALETAAATSEIADNTRVGTAAAIVGARAAREAVVRLGLLCKEARSLGNTLDHISHLIGAIRKSQHQVEKLLSDMLSRDELQAYLEEFVFQFRKSVREVESGFFVGENEVVYFCLLSGFLDRIGAESIDTPIIRGIENKATFDESRTAAQRLRDRLKEHPKVIEAIAWAEAVVRRTKEEEEQRRAKEELERQAKTERERAERELVDEERRRVALEQQRANEARERALQEAKKLEAERLAPILEAKRQAAELAARQETDRIAPYVEKERQLRSHRKELRRNPVVNWTPASEQISLSVYLARRGVNRCFRILIVMSYAPFSILDQRLWINFLIGLPITGILALFISLVYVIVCGVSGLVQVAPVVVVLAWPVLTGFVLLAPPIVAICLHGRNRERWDDRVRQVLELLLKRLDIITINVGDTLTPEYERLVHIAETVMYGEAQGKQITSQDVQFLRTLINDQPWTHLSLMELRRRDVEDNEGIERHLIAVGREVGQIVPFSEDTWTGRRGAPGE